MSNFDVFDFELSEEEMDLVCALHCYRGVPLSSRAQGRVRGRMRNESRVLKRAE